MSLYTYPSNKLEYLVQVLSKLLDTEKKDIFAPTQIMVGSRGMQHWLSMQLAENRSITMNVKYDMINAYILDICYELMAKHENKRAYTKDVLTWRVFNLLDEIKYEKLYKYYQNSLLKKYQLAAKISEVFSKYLTYRTDWLQGWEKGQYLDEKTAQDDEAWQMELWQKLVAKNPDTPYSVQVGAIFRLNKNNLRKINILKDIYIFGVNTISPKNLNFLFELGKYIDVNLLYVNPCSEYWGDYKPEKVKAWLNQEDYEQQPLLANLGQQGKEFFNQIVETADKEEFEVFENKAKLADMQQTQLVSIQRNLLELNCENYSNGKDNSISINSCHGPLREVQVLHDKLLDMVKTDKSIKPRDILVLCPNIEDYAPYIDSVFSRYAQDNKLPCSIADRTLLDSEPLAASFIDLLQLPESDFEVNRIMDYLSVPAIQKKFNISDEQLETIRYWLKEACIHHSNNGETFSWSWGLKRLMLGFGYSDKNEIINDNFMTVPIIEGSEIAELGGLYELLELLAEYLEQLLQLRSFEDWQNYLLEMFENVFDVTDDEQYIAKKIKDIIAKTVIVAKEMVGSTEIDLYTIRYCLISQLSEPIINNHFLNGKVTFCSMTPMRNVPFKVVAMLGLNSGKFPRQESAISFDIMARLDKRIGDRVRRDDDRYLFLEAILSAREYLYLSYVGRSIKTNVEQQSSLILKEFISYLKANYNWKDEDIKEYPLHAFSPKCYSDEYRSYDESWLNLLNKQPEAFYSPHSHTREDGYFLSDSQDYKDSHLCGNNETLLPKDLTISKLVKIFDNPLRAYANYSLELKLEDNAQELEDSEPFEIGGLENHDLKQKLLTNLSQNQSTKEVQTIAKLSGKLPESVLTDAELQAQVENMQKLVGHADIGEYEHKYFNVDILDHELGTSCYIKDNQIKLITTSTFRIKHKFELYLTALLAACEQQKDILAIYYFFDKDEAKDDALNISHLDAKELLEKYIKNAEKVVSKPSLAHLDLADALLGLDKGEVKTPKKQQSDWNNVVEASDHNYKALENDEYFKLFYSNIPKIGEFVGMDIYRDFFNIINAE